MLDGVDAPLDDYRTSDVMRGWSRNVDQVQFIYISHNKIAMEMADHLLGVTMHEPGVSAWSLSMWKRQLHLPGL